MQTNCYIDFNDILKEKLKNPEFKKHYKKAGEKQKIELQFNELLRTMGKKDLFVEVKNMSDY